jgi:endonuclease/exonuclease/phosphatase family metal-dependent hydrolase
MQRIASRIVEKLPCPSESLLEEAHRSPKDPESHTVFMNRIAAFDMVEKGGALEQRSWPGTIRVAAFNAERLASPDAVASLLSREGIDIALLCEVDSGMARSGNMQNARRLGALLGIEYVFGAEFVELDLGDEGEMQRHRGQWNACGLHGNAVLSQFGIEETHLIRLETSGLWFAGMGGAQHRIGGRIALAARITAPQPLWVVSVHLESKTGPADRQSQARTLLRALEELIGNAACIIAGDFNTKALPREEGVMRQALMEPEKHEPLFADLRAAGFAWQASNLAKATQRDGPWKTHDGPFGRLDWIFVRGIGAFDPGIVPAVDEMGHALSDHEMVRVSAAFQG